MRSYTPQHSDPNRQNRHPKRAVPLTHPQTAHASGRHSDLSRQKQLQNQTLSLTDADVATTSYTIQTQTGEKHPQIHYFPSEYGHAQLHATAFRPKQAKPTPKTGSSPHGRKVGTLALAHKTGQHLETALLNEGGTDQLRA